MLRGDVTERQVDGVNELGRSLARLAARPRMRRLASACGRPARPAPAPTHVRRELSGPQGARHRYHRLSPHLLPRLGRKPAATPRPVLARCVWGGGAADAGAEAAHVPAAFACVRARLRARGWVWVWAQVPWLLTWLAHLLPLDIVYLVPMGGGGERDGGGGSA